MRDTNSLENNLIIRDDLPRDSILYESEMNDFMVIHEGEQITEDIQLLRDMGYDNRMINKIYILLHPESIERAIDYMTEIDGIFQHNFFENNYHTKDRNLCFICKKPRSCHLDYIPAEFLEDNDYDYDFNFNNSIYNNNINNNNINNNININITNNPILTKKEIYICNVCFEDIDEDALKI